jgi:hypothetical protein
MRGKVFMFIHSIRNESLAQVHERLAHLSKIIREMERKFNSPLSLAQALVIVKDQVELTQMTASRLSLA